jgi:energy-coupling factor transporter ATP-binding protein EcfA2
MKSIDLGGRPLLDTAPDRDLFAGRDDELTDLVSSVERGRNVLVVGERGSGKTTLLRRLALALRERHPASPAPAFVEGSLATSPAQFLELVRYRLGLPPTDWQAERLGWDGDSLELPTMVAGLAEAAQRGRRVILVDEVRPDPIGRTIFGQLRDQVWQLPFTWVVAVGEDEVGPYRSPPANAFFDIVMTLRPLGREQQRSLLEARAGKRGARIAGRVDEGNPRRLLAIARQAIDGGAEPEALSDARGLRDARVARLGRPASMVMAELESLGPVSASDERLLQRLGWTRSRAVQVLRQLEAEGLVTSDTEKGDAGRPRKVYRPADLDLRAEPSKGSAR